MDRFRIEGGTSPARHGAHQRREKFRAAGHGRGAAHRRARAPAEYSPRARHHHHGPSARAHERPRGNARTCRPPISPFRRRKFPDAEAPYELVRTMRASILTLGPLVGRLGHARVSLPGGCAIGARPVDLHLKALEQMGAEITTEHGYVAARRPATAADCPAAHIVFEKITVTGTENILMAAMLADGETRIENAAREPEVTDLDRVAHEDGRSNRRRGNLLTARAGRSEAARRHPQHHSRPHRGGNVSGRGRDYRRRSGDNRLRAAASHRRSSPSCAKPASIFSKPTITLCAFAAPANLIAADVTTEEYPGFATDMQAQFMALATQAEGTSVITETIFENRFMHASEMVRMGANISIDGRKAIVRGPTALAGQQRDRLGLARQRFAGARRRWWRTARATSTASTTSTAATNASRKN